MTRRSQAEKIVDLLSTDIQDVKDGRYQEYVRPHVYVMGNDYYAAWPTKPKHEDFNWVELRNFRGETIWESVS